tara:strand:- start:684 stop:1823 length:1140 start_codon:yes stop_codon:yes gene_type:complete
MHQLALTLAVSVLSGAVLAQNQTWIVDTANGVGTNFTDLPAAVIAAQPGDSIVVRAGDYTGVSVYEGISILGESGARIVFGGPTYTGILVSQIPAGQTCSVSGLQILVANPLSGSLHAINNAGNVLFERITTISKAWVSDCANMRIEGCSLADLVVINTALSMSHSSGFGAGGGFNTSRPALQLTNSAATLSRCTLHGFDQVFSFPSSAAITMAGGSLLVTDDGTGQIKAGVGQTRSAIDGNGSVAFDSHVAFVPANGAPSIAATVTSASQIIPSLRALGAPAGGTVNIDLFSQTGDAYFLFGGLMVPPTPLPFWGGSAWLMAPLMFESGFIDATQRAFVTVPVPSSPVVYGYAFTIQALTASAAGVYVSNSGSYVHGS